MKARVKATGNIVDVEWYGHDSMGTIYADVTHTTKYYEYELDFDTVYDYWTRLEHQYAGIAMQGLMSLSEWPEETTDVDVIETASKYAHALVEKYKKEERK
jgi:hypothetical protein